MLMSGPALYVQLSLSIHGEIRVRIFYQKNKNAAIITIAFLLCFIISLKNKNFLCCLIVIVL